MEHPKDVGDRSMLAVKLALREAGYAMYVPFGENTRVDLALDDGSRLLRVQCKTGRLRNGSVRFKVCSSYAHHPNPRHPRRDYIGQIDYFAVYCPETTGVYLVPIERSCFAVRERCASTRRATASGSGSGSRRTTKSRR